MLSVAPPTHLTTHGHLVVPTMTRCRASPTMTLEEMSRTSSSYTLVDEWPHRTLLKDTSLLTTTTESPQLVQLCQQCLSPLPFKDNNPDLHVGSQRPVQSGRSPDLKLSLITDPLKAQLKTRLSALERPIKIVGLLATADSGCRTYAEMTSRSCKNNGIEFVKVDLLESGTERGVGFDRVKRMIEFVNADKSVDGLIVYFPLFDVDKDNELRRLISPRIDVEGVQPINLHRSYIRAAPLVSELEFADVRGDSESVVYPCTPLAVVQVLQRLKGVYDVVKPVGKRLEGKTVMVINRSETVGRPLAAILTNEGAKTYSVDIASIQLQHRAAQGTCVQTIATPLTQLIPECDVIITAVPGDHFRVPTKNLMDGAVCIDLSEKGNFEADVGEKAGCWAPRIGAVTILMLQFNALVLRGHNV